MKFKRTITFTIQSDSPEQLTKIFHKLWNLKFPEDKEQHKHVNVTVVSE